MRKSKLLLIFVVALFLFAGCGKKETAEVPATIEEKTSDETSTASAEEEKKEEEKKEEEKTEDESENAEKINSAGSPEFDIVSDNSVIYSTNSRDEVGSMSVSYLQLSGGAKDEFPKLSAVLDEINKESKKKYEASISDFTVEARRFHDRLVTENLAYGFDECWNLNDITVVRADGDYTSFFIRSFNFWGDGEAADRYKCLNLNSKTGKGLEFSDIVTDESGFEKAVEELYADKFDTTLNVIGKANPTKYDWCLTPIGINVYFSMEYPAISSVCGNYINVGFDAYPDIFNEEYRPKYEDYVYPINSDEDLLVDIDNDGKVNKVSFDVKVPEGAEGTNECEGYTISIDDVKYDDFGENWFFEWQPYYVHTAEGAYIYAYLGGYESDKVDIIKLDGKSPQYDKSVAADNLYAIEEAGEGDVFRYRAIAFTKPESLFESDFATAACGKYIYQPVVSEDEEGMGEWLFEIYEFDGKYYMEELGDYNYGAAEIELLSDTPQPCTDGYSYRIKIHYFSGFSFAGDYHGSGYECDFVAHEDGSIVLKGEQPFGQGGDIMLFPYYDNYIHFDILNSTTENLDCPEAVGAWRYSGTNEDGEKFENFLELREDGTAVLVSKTDTYPVQVSIGNYQVFLLRDMNEATITFYGEIMGYACQPSDEMEFSYDYESDTLSFAPNGYDDESSVMEYHRTSPGVHETNIVPGPASRVDELMKDWEEYNNY